VILNNHSKIDYLQQSDLRKNITRHYYADEAQLIKQLIKDAALKEDLQDKVSNIATNLVTAVRSQKKSASVMDSFMTQYDLSNDEGIALMCLAEALLRVPDKATADALIKDKILSADWASHKGQSESLFVNATTWGLMLTGKIYTWNQVTQKNLQNALINLVTKGGEPFIRGAANYAMKILGKQFVMGRTITEAQKRGKSFKSQNYRYSFDMLGEAARTMSDANRYYEAYYQAIEAIGRESNHLGPILASGVSVKLSALHPRYELAQYSRVFSELYPQLLTLAQLSAQYDIGLTIDAEEADRLDLSLDIFEALMREPSLAAWQGLGIAVQSYQRRGFAVIEWLADLAKTTNKRIMIRLIKGAYWDSEIKHSQDLGLSNYPVFTRKPSTDISFLACAKQIIKHGNCFYPQFATHNAYSVAAILAMVGDQHCYEFQCLHGMGKTLYDEVFKHYKINCRIYAPVGSHQGLLPYLVRRLLENGANTSFVNRLADKNIDVTELTQNPITKVQALTSASHPKLPLPRFLYRDRLNSIGINLSHYYELYELEQGLTKALLKTWQAAPLVPGADLDRPVVPIFNPADNSQTVGTLIQATAIDARNALDNAERAYTKWSMQTVDKRAKCLERMADLIEQHRYELMALVVREAGKTIGDAIAEYREAADFCRYYAKNARELMGNQFIFQGPTGEQNTMRLLGRGVVLCISPWNFPLAIFIGQVSAALVTGNCVLAKPAEQTPLIADYAVKLFHQAGVPETVLQSLPGVGRILGDALLPDNRIQSVLFTGSIETARIISQTLAQRQGPLVQLIAETGGQNAMIVDSSALPEQVVQDILYSAFYSAGQRCSALRVLYVQDEIADKLMTMLKGAMAELQIGDPALLSTDVGPVIDKVDQKNLLEHIDHMQSAARWIYQSALPKISAKGTFVAPTLMEIEHISQLKQEKFGPICHVIRYELADLDQVIADINHTGYGLTMGIHSRIDERVDYIAERMKVGNVYVNRAMTGAVVGVQPFGGEGLSGTGPKAGGPHYLLRLCVERTLSIDTTAAGGNASLMTLRES